MIYFEDFPIIQYPYVGKLTGTPDDKISYVNIVDLMIRFKFSSQVLKSPLSYYEYIWGDNDRPDIVASKYYGDANYAWVVMLSSYRFDFFYDFPMPSTQFNDYIVSKYGSFSSAASTVHHYEDGSGYVIDLETYTGLSDPEKKAISVFEYEDQINESKRKVKLISRKFLPQIVKEYEDMIKNIKESRDLLTTPQVMVS